MTLSLSLLFAEWALRRFFHIHPPPAKIFSYRPELYRADETVGFTVWPSRVTTYEYPHHNPRQLTVNSNSRGFRQAREFGVRDPRDRICFVGDSFVFGEGVEEGERFTDVIQSARPTWLIENMGMTGFGPGLMLRTLETVALPTRPKMVVMCFYTDDFRRVAAYYAGTGFEIPRYAFIDGELVSHDYPARVPFLHRSSIFTLCKRTFFEGSYGWDLTRAIVDRSVSLSRENDAVVVFAFLPRHVDGKRDRRDRAWLRRRAEDMEVPFIDLTKPILDAGADAFIPNNPHYNPRGHGIVARKLIPFLEESLR